MGAVKDFVFKLAAPSEFLPDDTHRNLQALSVELKVEDNEKKIIKKKTDLCISIFNHLEQAPEKIE